MKLTLSMIVKNETHIIKECFDTIYDQIDYWVIVDTGSTDGTQEFIKNYLLLLKIAAIAEVAIFLH